MDNILFNYLYIAGMRYKDLAQLTEFDNFNNTVGTNVLPEHENADIYYETFIETLVDAVLYPNNSENIINEYLTNTLGYDTDIQEFGGGGENSNVGNKRKHKKNISPQKIDYSFGTPNPRRPRLVARRPPPRIVNTGPIVPPTQA